jgi:DNA-binding CsgD family transcriptional regulator
MRGSSKTRGNQGSPKARVPSGIGIAQPAATGRDLTERERQVLGFVSDGFEDREIANQLGIAQSSVSALLRSAMAKLDSRTRLQAVARLAEVDELEETLHA